MAFHRLQVSAELAYAPLVVPDPLGEGLLVVLVTATGELQAVGRASGPVRLDPAATTAWDTFFTVAEGAGDAGDEAAGASGDGDAAPSGEEPGVAAGEEEGAAGASGDGAAGEGPGVAAGEEVTAEPAAGETPDPDGGPAS